jgi:ketosteroid isomerase-like protein
MPRNLAFGLFLFLALLPFRSHAEEVRLESCDKLPLIPVTVPGGKLKLRFLVDTAATSMLNSKSFTQGDSRMVAVTSWSGTVEAQSREVTVPELVVGQHRLTDLRLPAIDLSAIGNSCGKRIDGILGIDLLSRLGATVDLRRHTAQLVAGPPETEAVIAELHQHLSGCQEAFNRGDEAAFAECLDPQIVTFTVAGDFYGRDAALAYYRKKYFQAHPPAHLSMVMRAHHLIGDAVWMEYDLKIVSGQQIITARGTALCRKDAGRWRIVHMNHSSPPAAEIHSPGSSR